MVERRLNQKRMPQKIIVGRRPNASCCRPFCRSLRQKQRAIVEPAPSASRYSTSMLRRCFADVLLSLTVVALFKSLLLLLRSFLHYQHCRHARSTAITAIRPHTFSILSHGCRRLSSTTRWKVSRNCTYSHCLEVTYCYWSDFHSDGATD